MRNGPRPADRFPNHFRLLSDRAEIRQHLVATADQIAYTYVRPARVVAGHPVNTPKHAVEKRHEEVGMHGARERGSEAYREYVEVPSEQQHRRPAPQ